MVEITIKQEGQRFIAAASYEQRAFPKAAGFRWDPIRKHWYTTESSIADKLRDPSKIVAKVEQRQLAKNAAIASSRASSADVSIPVPEGLEYLPYQRAGIAFGLDHANVLFGDEMGLGKTIQAIGIVNADESLKKILVICPASLRLNWQRELNKWLVRPMSSVIVSGQSWPSGFDISIINYDILAKHSDRLRSAFDAVIIDEAHYCKNPDAKRTIAVVGKDAKKGQDAIPGINARRRIALTGTPIPNRPIEGYPIFHYLAPDVFRSFFGYAKTFCDAQQTGYGWDFSGSSNLARLQDDLRSSIMVRRKKADVLTELPAKRRAIIELAANGAASAIKAEQDAYARHESMIEDLRVAVELAKASDNPTDYEAAVANLRKAASAAFTEMSKVRHATAVAKIPYVIAHITDSLEQSGHKVVCFAHHTDVLDALKTAFPQAAMIRGDVAMQARQDSVDRFQSDPACNLFLGQIQAAGVGITLTAADHVVFAELDWVPGNVSQAEDRCHRIGQRNTVLVQHLVLEGSMDARMAMKLVAKQRVIDDALDNERAEVAEAPEVPTRDRAATENTSRAKLDADAALMTDARRDAIHAGLRILAGSDADFAATLNGIGFNRMDTMIGHSLADSSRLTDRQAALGAKLVNKYRRQLPAEIVEAAK